MSARVILHVDMDAFYAAVEQRDDPALRGQKLIIGGPSRRGVVCTASYEARPFGVHSAMPMAQALRLCPDAVVIAPRMGHYAAVSEQVMDVLSSFSPQLEALSLDEAFLDMTGAEGLFGPPLAMAHAIKAAVFERTALTCSVGVARNKFLAKLASDLDKPDGVTLVPFGDEAAFIAPLPLRRLWGVGPRAAEALGALGLATIGDIARADRARLTHALGPAMAQHLAALARAEDEREVEADRGRKSVGSETTLDADLRGRADVEAVLRRQAERVARQLRDSDLLASGVRVKLRYARGFRLATRQTVLGTPYDDGRTLFESGRGLLDRLDLDAPIRLVGAAAFLLESRAAPQQLDLFQQKERDARSKLEHALDAINRRFGPKIGFGP